MGEGSVFEARARFTELLREVGRGATIVVTKRGKPVARIVPFEERPQVEIDEAVRRLKELRRGVRLGGLDWRELWDAGRP
jgi:prevent-host-death family protein